MSYNKSIIIILLFLLITLSVIDAEEVGMIFLKFPHTGQGSGLGEAVSALSMNSEGVFWNPASMSGAEDISLSFNYASLVENFSLNSLTFVYPYPGIGNFGLGISYFNQGSIKETTILEPDGTGASIFSYDLGLTITYSRTLFKKIKSGIALKYFSSHLGDEVGSGLALGFGGIYQFNTSLSFGFWLNNLGSGVKYISEKDPLPFQARAGAGYRLDSYLFLLDAVYDLEEGFGICLGTEINIYNDMFKFRAGYKSYDSANPYALGINLNYMDFAIDYSYIPISQKGLFDFNQVSISYKF